jgi:beta-N-acetylhexosaminidase
VGCALMIISALTGCATVPSAAPPIAVTPSGSTTKPASPTSSPSGATAPTPAESFMADEACTELVLSMSLSERVGQLLMVGVSSSGMSASEKAIIDRTRAGSVILLGNSKAGMEAISGVVSSVRDAAPRPEDVEVMLAVDQEGGLVQRLKGSGFTTIPPATIQARQSDAQLRRKAHEWGDQLRDAGIDANLAPVADVVPMPLAWVNLADSSGHCSSRRVCGF